METRTEQGEIGFTAGLVATLVSIAFGSNVVAIKTSMKGLGVFTNVGARFVISTLAILVWAVLSGKKIGIEPGKWTKLLFVSACLAIQISLFNFGLSLTLATRATLIVNLQPFVVLILASFVLAEEHFSWAKLWGTVCGFAGVGSLFVGQDGMLGNLGLGDACVLGCTLFWGINIVYIKKISMEFEPFELALYPIAFALPVFFAEGLLFDEQLVKYVDTEIVLAMLYQGLVTGAAGFVLWNTLIRRFGAVSLNFFVFVVPIAGVVSSVLVLNEPFSWNILLALAFIVLGVLIVNKKPKDARA